MPPSTFPSGFENEVITGLIAASFGINCLSTLSIGLRETKGPLIEIVIGFAKPSRDLAMSTPETLPPMSSTLSLFFFFEKEAELKNVAHV